MSAAKKPKPTSPNPAEDLPEPRRRGWDPRDGLGIYAERPEDNPEGRVVDYDDDFVVIRDKFPKARYTQHSPECMSAYTMILTGGGIACTFC